MRTVQVDSDHIAKYSKTAKNVYQFTVGHAATGRPVLEGSWRSAKGDASDQVESDVAAEARRLLLTNAVKRDEASRRFAAGKSVPNAPQLPPAQAKARAAGELDVPATLPVRLIRDAYKTVVVLDGESVDSWRSRCSSAALDIGHKVLIGAPDVLILGIARGEYTLTGSLRQGVTVVGVTA